MKLLIYDNVLSGILFDRILIYDNVFKWDSFLMGLYTWRTFCTFFVKKGNFVGISHIF